MMKYLISVIFALGVIGPSAALAAERTVTLAVQNDLSVSDDRPGIEARGAGIRERRGKAFLLRRIGRAVTKRHGAAFALLKGYFALQRRPGLGRKDQLALKGGVIWRRQHALLMG
jgi:hypothetical protein